MSLFFVWINENISYHRNIVLRVEPWEVQDGKANLTEFANLSDSPKDWYRDVIKTQLFSCSLWYGNGVARVVRFVCHSVYCDLNLFHMPLAYLMLGHHWASYHHWKSLIRYPVAIQIHFVSAVTLWSTSPITTIRHIHWLMKALKSCTCSRS